MTSADVYLSLLGPGAALVFGLFVWASARFFPAPAEGLERIEKMPQVIDGAGSGGG